MGDQEERLEQALLSVLNNLEDQMEHLVAKAEYDNSGLRVATTGIYREVLIEYLTECIPMQNLRTMAKKKIAEDVKYFRGLKNEE